MTCRTPQTARTRAAAGLALCAAVAAAVCAGCTATYAPVRPRLVPEAPLDERIGVFQRHRLHQAGGWLMGYQYWSLANPERAGEWPDVDVLFEQFEETSGTLTVSRVLGVVGEIASALGSGLAITGAICMSGRSCFGNEVDVALLATGIALEFVSSALTVSSRALYGDLGEAYNAALFDRLELGAPEGPPPWDAPGSEYAPGPPGAEPPPPGGGGADAGELPPPGPGDGAPEPGPAPGAAGPRAPASGGTPAPEGSVAEPPDEPPAPVAPGAEGEPPAEPVLDL